MIIRPMLQAVKRLGQAVLHRLGPAPNDDRISGAMVAWMDAHKELSHDKQIQVVENIFVKFEGVSSTRIAARSMIFSRDALPPLTLAILVLHVHHAMRVAEISQRFEISERHVRRHIRLAIRIVAQKRMPDGREF